MQRLSSTAYRKLLKLRLYSIAPGNDFLDVLATALLQGFPLATDEPQPPLSAWTILVPTRRSARTLEKRLFEIADQLALVMPRIKPIGDIDEDLIDDSLPEDGVPNAISKAGQLHLLLAAVKAWAGANPQYGLSQDILASPVQCFNLTLSLQELLTQTETEETGFDKLQTVYELDLAGHRTAILSLLGVIATDLPARLHEAGLMGPAARRNRMIRLEATRIAGGLHRGPIVAAGSTGTNPATRDLLKAIASHPQGAVILPGLDTHLDAAAWQAVTPEHPQYAMALMLQQWGVERQQVETMGQKADARQWLLSAALRPSAVADTWRNVIAEKPVPVADMLQNLSLIEAHDRQEEAKVIALRLRHHAVAGTGPAAVITPDRALGQRIKAELAQWNMIIDDSSGEALSHVGAGALLVLLVRALAENFTSTTLIALLHHPLCTMGYERETFLGLARHLEMACFRGKPASKGIAGLAGKVVAAQHEVISNSHAHPLLKKLTPEEWQELQAFAAQLAALFADHDSDTAQPLEYHIAHLDMALQGLAPDWFLADEANLRLQELLEGLKAASPWAPPLNFDEAAPLLLHHLQQETLRPPQNPETQFMLYGLLEARLMPAGLVILAGLNEGSWPAIAQSGPWLNRPMRQSFGLQQPEREIGLTAHDFVQALGHGEVVVTWSKRAAGQPLLVSRWILRLRAVLDVLGHPKENHLHTDYLEIASKLDQPGSFKPHARPEARPPVAARPRRFSVSDVENLIRDSYHIHAHKILALYPVDPPDEDIDAGLRGDLIHQALHAWALENFSCDEADLQRLLAHGKTVFQPYMDMAEVRFFWWPRFVRMATTLIPIEEKFRADARHVWAEVKARHRFMVAGVEHLLTARADRIDQQGDESFRLLDYKSGAIPSAKTVASGFAPQLPLEAALLGRGAFEGVEPGEVTEAFYVEVSGGAKPAHLVTPNKNQTMGELGEKHFESLQNLLATYLSRETAYIPRHHLMLKDAPARFDHLSRRLEWELAGEKP